jgi:hypothetical protein
VVEPAPVVRKARVDSDGVLVFDPANRTEATNAELVTDQTVTNFELDLEWMIFEEGNSGVFWA